MDEEMTDLRFWRVLLDRLLVEGADLLRPLVALLRRRVALSHVLALLHLQPYIT